MFGIFLPSLLKKKTRCPRCTKQYEAKLERCPHCENIADGKPLEQYIEDHQQQLKDNGGLGYIFIAVAVLMVIALSISALL